MKKSLLFAAALALASLAQAQAPEWKKIRIGVEGAYPPFSEIGPDGKLKGFEASSWFGLLAPAGPGPAL